MEDEHTNKILVTFPEGTNKAELIIREGQAAPELEPLAPLRINITGTIGAPAEFIRGRVDQPDQINPKRTHVLVDRDQVSITLVANENDAYNYGVVKGILQLHPKYVEFGINSGKTWAPNELGQFFKMNRAFFADIATNRKLVSDLKNYIASVNAKIEKQSSEQGSFKDNYSGVVQSNLPEAFKLHIPIFNGMPAEDIEVEFYASVNGRDVSLLLISPGACQLLEEARNVVIDNELSKIRDYCDLVIIEQ